jgi:hypothetical protein
LVVFVLQPAKRTPPNTSRTKSSNTQRTETKTTDVVIHQHSRKLLMMDIWVSETCWAHKKWNKIVSDIKLVFHSSTNEITYDIWGRENGYRLVIWLYRCVSNVGMWQEDTVLIGMCL